MANARTANITNTAVTTLVRDEILDPSTDPAGLSIPEAQREFTDAQIFTAIQLATHDLDRKFRIKHPGSSLISTDTTYTSGAASTNLPGGIGRYDPIVKVENIADPLQPVLIPYVQPWEIERYATAIFATNSLPQRVPFWHTLIDSGTDRAIVIRPRPQGLAIRIWTIATAVIPGLVADDNLLSSHWQDLVVLKTAIILKSRKNMATDQQMMRFTELMADFTKAANRQRQPAHVRRVRKGIS